MQLYQSALIALQTNDKCEYELDVDCDGLCSSSSVAFMLHGNEWKHSKKKQNIMQNGFWNDLRSCCL